MNRRALVREIGISPTTLCRVAAGHMSDMKTCKKLADWLGDEVPFYLVLKKDSPRAVP